MLNETTEAKNSFIVIKPILVWNVDWVYKPHNFLSKYIWSIDPSGGFAQSRHIKARALEYNNMSLDAMVKDSLIFRRSGSWEFNLDRVNTSIKLHIMWH